MSYYWEMGELGKSGTFRVVRLTDHGAYLDAGRLGEVLLPRKYEPEGLQPGDEMEVFLYRDSEERPVATTEIPAGEVGDFAFLKVESVTRHGAFLDWGVSRALFLPFREQKEKVREGEELVVRIGLDPKTDRLVATSRLNRFLSDETAHYQPGDRVELLLYAETPLGYKAIVDNSHSGILYRTELLRPVRVGDRLPGYIAQVREDGKLDLSLQPAGRERVEEFVDTLWRELQQAGGMLPFGDQSAPEEIRERFGVSKKTFKRAAGALFKERKIVIYPRQIVLQK